MRDETRLETAVAVEAHDLFVTVTADAVRPAGELGEYLAHFESVAQIVDDRIAEWGHGGGEPDFVPVTARPAWIPGLDLADLGAGEDRLVLKGDIAEIDPVVGRHFPADVPAVLLVAAVREGIALLQRLGGAAIGARPGVEGAGDLARFQVHKDMEDAAGAGRVMEGQVNAPVFAAGVIHQPARHRDHGRVGRPDVAEDGPHLRIGRGNGHRLRQDFAAAAGTGRGVGPTADNGRGLRVDDGLNRTAVRVVIVRDLHAGGVGAAVAFPVARLAGCHRDRRQVGQVFAPQQLPRRRIGADERVNGSLVYKIGCTQPHHGPGHVEHVLALCHRKLDVLARVPEVPEHGCGDESGQGQQKSGEAEAGRTAHRYGLYAVRRQLTSSSEAVAVFSCSPGREPAGGHSGPL